MTIESPFSLRQRVHIIPLNLDGIVWSIWLGEDGLQINVRYFYNGKAETVYFSTDELTAVITDPQRPGFTILPL